MFILGAQKVQIYTIVLNSKALAFKHCINQLFLQWNCIANHSESQGLPTTAFMFLTHGFTDQLGLFCFRQRVLSLAWALGWVHIYPICHSLGLRMIRLLLCRWCFSHCDIRSRRGWVEQPFLGTGPQSFEPTFHWLKIVIWPIPL